MSSLSSSPRAAETPFRRLVATRALGELIFALLITLLGIYVVLSARGILVPPGNEAMGPRDFPYIVGSGLTLLGALLIIQVLRGKLGTPDESEDFDTTAATSWVTVALLAGIILLHAQLIEPIGWPVVVLLAITAAAIAVVSHNRYLALAAAIAVLVALLLQLETLSPLGWPIAAVVLFSGFAFTLGNRRWVLTLAISVGLALLLQFLFAYVMGLSLPAGPGLERLVIFNG